MKFNKKMSEIYNKKIYELNKILYLIEIYPFLKNIEINCLEDIYNYLEIEYFIFPF